MSRDVSRPLTPLGTQIIDSEGFTVHARHTSAALSAFDPDQAGGQAWPRLLPEPERRVAEAALRAAFEGRAAEYSGTIDAGDTVLPYHVNLVPLEWEGDTVSRVCAVFVRSADGSEARQRCESLRDQVHTFANLTSVANSAANILRRGVDETRAAMLADSLEDAGRRAADAVNTLRATLGLPPAAE